MSIVKENFVHARNKTYLYNDEYMVFDTTFNQYILTEDGSKTPAFFRKVLDNRVCWDII